MTGSQVLWRGEDTEGRAREVLTSSICLEKGLYGEFGVQGSEIWTLVSCCRAQLTLPKNKGVEILCGTEVQGEALSTKGN